MTQRQPLVAPAIPASMAKPRFTPPVYVDRLPSPRKGFVYLACDNPSCDRGGIFEIAEHRVIGGPMSCSDTCAGDRARYERALQEKKITTIPGFKSIDVKMVCSTCGQIDRIGHSSPVGKLLANFICSACSSPRKKETAA